MIELPNLNELGEDCVQVNCIECQGKAVIGTRVAIDPKVTNLYCSCKDPQCGHTFVMTLSFSHTLSPAANQSKRLMLDMLKSLPKDEQQQLFEMAQAH